MINLKYIELNGERLSISEYKGYKYRDKYFTINSLTSIYENNYLVIGYINNCYSFFKIVKSSHFYEITHLEEIKMEEIRDNYLFEYIEDFIKKKEYEYPLRIESIELDDNLYLERIREMNYHIKVGLRRGRLYNINELYYENGRVIGMIRKKKWGSLIINPSVIIKKYLEMEKNEIPYHPEKEFNIEFILNNEVRDDIDDLDNHIKVKYHKMIINDEYQISYPLIEHLNKLNNKYKISDIIKNQELLKTILE